MSGTAYFRLVPREARSALTVMPSVPDSRIVASARVTSAGVTTMSGVRRTTSPSRAAASITSRAMPAAISSLTVGGVASAAPEIAASNRSTSAERSSSATRCERQPDRGRLLRRDAALAQVVEERVGERRVGWGARGAQHRDDRAPGDGQIGTDVQRMLGVVRGERLHHGCLDRRAERVGHEPLADGGSSGGS